MSVLEIQVRGPVETAELDCKVSTRGKETRWSPCWERCWLCGTQEFPHRGRGLCSLCYVRLRALHRLPPLADYVVEGGRNAGAWSRDHPACTACGTTRRPHHARGLCRRCYMRWLRGGRGASSDRVEHPGAGEDLPREERVLASI